MKTVDIMSSAKARRLESRKRKAAAFLEIAKLNDQDKETQKVDDEGANKAKKAKSSEQNQTPARLSDKPILKGVDYADLKAQLRARKKQLQQLPRFELKTLGHDASVDYPPNIRIPLLFCDLQNVLTYSMVGDRTPYQPFCWCRLDKWTKLTHVNCLFVEGLSVADFFRFRDQMKSFDQIFENKLEFVSPLSYESTTARDLCILPVTKLGQRKLASEFGNIAKAMEEETAFRVFKSMFPVRKQKRSSISLDSDEMPLKVRLLLGVRQMLFENYPLPLDGKMKEKYAEYVMTKDSYEEVSQDSPMFSIDCEMCMTDTGTLELTRICVVDAELKVVFHSLVKPHNQITNYLTKFSGITPDMLVDVETRLSDVQDKLREIIPANAILIGQSLNSDLHALKMMHPYVIDTSVIFNITGQRRRKTKLSVLASLFLGETIQAEVNELGEAVKGHNPIEDAQAAMKLVNLKLEKGYEFGDVILNGSVPNLVDKTNPKKAEDNTVLGTSVARLLQTNNKSMKIVCQNEVRHDYSVIPSVDQYLIEAKTAKEALQLTTDDLFNNNLNICHISVPEVKADDNQDCESLKRVRKMTKKLWKHTSENGLFLTVWGGKKSGENAFVGISLKKATRPQ